MKRFKFLSIVFVLIVSVFCLTACKEDKDPNNNRNIYEVLSNSMYPAISAGDKIIVEPKDNYVIGDIIMFNLNPNIVVTHRIIGIFEENGETYYICHGDNVQNIDGTESNADWRDDAEYVQNLITENKTKIEMEDEFGFVANIITCEQIRGVVVDVVHK